MTKTHDTTFNVAFNDFSHSNESTLFLTYAPQYWRAGLPVFPLWAKKKEPMFSGWREYSVVMPPEELREHWKQQNSNSNIGLPLGPCSGISVIDIDTDDVTIIKAILEVLPNPLWVRKGAKGAVLAYKHNPSLKTFRIRTINNESIVEYLSEGTYVVLPPSIHPKTDKPYTENRPLWEVKDGLPTLPTNIEDTLRNSLKKVGVSVGDSKIATKVTEFVPSGARDISLTRAAGLFAFAVLRGERSLLEALDMLHIYAAQYVENIIGDPVDMNKHTANLILFLSRDIMQKGRILPEGWDSGMTEAQRAYYRKAFSEDHIEKPAKVIMSDLEDVFSNNDGKGTDDVMQEVEKTLKLLAFSKNLSALEVDRILHLMSRESGLGVRVASLNKQIKNYREMSEFKGANHTEIAQALIEELETINKIKFFNDKFFRWGGSHYEVYQNIELEREIHLRYGSCEANKKRSDAKGILHTMGALQSAPLRDPDLMETGVNFANGYVIRREDGSLELHTHEEKFGATYTLPFIVDLKQVNDNLRKLAPTFYQFLETSWGHDPDFTDKVQALQEAIFVTLFGLAPQYQRAFLLFGMANSGKSQLLTIISSLVPPEVKSAVSPDAWADNFAPASMAGKLLNIAGELSETRKISGQIFKEVIDGSEMSVRAPYGQAFTTRMIAAQWFAGNFLPRTKDTSNGFNRRWLIFQFCRPIPEHERKVNLGEYIVNNERAGILQWCLGASKRLVKQKGYTLPASARNAVAEMGALNNTIRAFLEAANGGIRLAVRDVSEGRIMLGKKRVKYDPQTVAQFTAEYKVQETKLYELYWAWAVTNTEKKPESIQGFKQAMKELVLSFELRVVEARGTATYYGISTEESAKSALKNLGYTIG